ncbi:hypothetical protein HanXRQr2_Chr13g0598681 [Helianthus annuus]|uniref:Uncharacterized protein n=1 Tax=Helianthus annuus TaxID=4232 RepID=A0A9K3HCS7_HELAN|nr:hypothetical protein HanXRQr2_Chr13g0598681 [Helianthus annuus]KAJ0850107.1 hypothetical protein HanPSC8_Chr13g0576751 [Helianthus annuus]
MKTKALLINLLLWVKHCWIYQGSSTAGYIKYCWVHNSGRIK